jgi:multiple sugar transport system permease protein
MQKSELKQAGTWYLFLLPSILVLILFMTYPILDSLRLSFYKSNGTYESWIGLRNYVRIFTSYSFWRALYTTMYIGLFKLLIAIPLGFFIAYQINNLRFGKNLFKIAFFIPYITSVVAAGMIFLFILHPGEGLLNSFLGWFGIPPQLWLAEPTPARWGTILLTVWHWLGFVIIICMANLQTIAPELYEAAQIDGANEWHTFWAITIPKMTSCFAFLLVMGWISALKIFTEPYILGRGTGTPAGALMTLSGFIYDTGFQGSEFGYSSAAAYVLFFIILIFTRINMKISKMEM